MGRTAASGLTDFLDVPVSVADPAAQPGRSTLRTYPLENPPAVICVDLDGTLTRTDTLHECLCACARDPGTYTSLPGWIRQGKGALKSGLAARARLDPALLPYNDAVLAYLAAERAKGRRILLTTGANKAIADAVAGHLGLFDGVIASSATDNLRGPAKADAIRRALGGTPFTYVGNDRTDLDVWKEAGSCVVVNAPAGVLDRVRALGRLEGTISDRPNALGSILRAARPLQWVKNLLVFVPIVTARAIFDFHAWAMALVLLVALSAAASSIYLVNDLVDLASDRQHRSKRHRPLAAGELPLHVPILLAPLLAATGLALGWLVGAGWVVALYMMLSIAYSLWLKAVPLADLFTLAALYTIRVVAGGEATGYTVSLWLLAFSGFLFLSLAIIKRVAELMPLAGNDVEIAGRAYRGGDLPILQLMGVSATFISSLVLALYVDAATREAGHTTPNLLWLIVPAILFWQCRIWLATTRGQMHDDPIVFAVHDRLAWLVGGLAVLAFIGTAVSP